MYSIQSHESSELLFLHVYNLFIITFHSELNLVHVSLFEIPIVQFTLHVL